MIAYNFKSIHIIICIVLIMLLWLFYILKELDENLQFFQKKNNGENESSGGGGDKKPSGDDEPNPKNENLIIAGLLSFIEDNKKVIIGVVLGTIILTGGYFLLNHYDIVPDVLSYFRNDIKEVILPISEEIVRTNNLIEEAMNIARFENESLPNYFQNLSITEENFIPGFNGFETYVAYKQGLLQNFLQLYDGVDRNIVDITKITPSIFIENKILNLYVSAMQKFPLSVSVSIITVQKEIVRNTFQEELFLVEKPELIPIFKALMLLLQKAIINQSQI